MYKCKKCGCEKFIDTFKAYNALFGYCENCGESARLESSPEWEEQCKQTVIAQNTRSTTPTITCPYCQSTNTSKISTTSRMLSAGLFGLGSKKIGKQWHCGKCGSDF